MFWIFQGKFGIFSVFQTIVYCDCSEDHLPSGVRPVGDLVEWLAGTVAPGHLPLAVVHIAAGPEVGGGSTAQNTDEVVSLSPESAV